MRLSPSLSACLADKNFTHQLVTILQEQIRCLGRHLRERHGDNFIPDLKDATAAMKDDPLTIAFTGAAVFNHICETAHLLYEVNCARSRLARGCFGSGSRTRQAVDAFRMGLKTRATFYSGSGAHLRRNDFCKPFGLDVHRRGPIEVSAPTGAAPIDLLASRASKQAALNEALRGS